MVKISLVGPEDLRPELEQMLRSKGLSVSSAPPVIQPGCDYESTSLCVGIAGAETGGLNRLCQAAVAEWNDKYPPFGIWIDE